MKDKKDLHYLRKLNHSIPGVLIFLALALDIIKIESMTKFIIVSYLLISFIEIFRLTHKPFNLFFCKNFFFLLREKELDKPTTTTFYLLSLSIIILFFPIEIFYIALLTLSIGDPLASIIGIQNKDNKNNYKFKNRKSLYGTLALTSVAFFFSVCVLPFYGYKFTNIMNFAIIYSVLLFIMEATVEHLDDNLYIPLLVIPSFFLLFIS